ncbi:MAG: DUF6320 domain-containing protein [Spirochaetia bacterium]|jgi:hypothetical protein|nr:DUF6320 domain-containing protein [Spirochaetia bacterium]
MPICPDCGVILPESVTHCPLCRKAIRTQDTTSEKDIERAYPEHAVDPEHFEQVSDRQKLKNFLEVFGVFSVVACITLLSIELLVEHRIGWSLFPVASIVYLYILISMPMAIRKRPWLAGVVIALASILFILALDIIDPCSSWFLPVGLPIVIIVEASLFCCVAIIVKLKRKGINAIAIALLGATAICVGIEMVMDIAAGGSIRLGWSAVVAVTCLPISGLLLYLHHRIINRVSLKKLFHL